MDRKWTGDEEMTGIYTSAALLHF